MLRAGALLALSVLWPRETQLPGTQPRELTSPPEPSTSCTCHNFYGDNPIEPGRSYRPTMMAISARDPLFRSALRIASRDRPDLSDLCIRCHAPIGWLSGRSTPGDGSALQDDDLTSVSCDMCHRMTPREGTSVQLIGDGQFTLSQELTKRAARGNGPRAGHRVIRQTFTGSSELCGTCHSLFNPSEQARGADGAELGVNYYEQRTYEEWADSVFPARQKSCIECHMKKVHGKAAEAGEIEYDDLRLHMIVGGNDFSPRAVDFLDPDSLVGNDLPELIQAVGESLRSAATLTITSTLPRPLVARGRSTLEVGVRLTNKTGHKLPTGYPEGRRVYLEVSLKLAGSSTQTISGAWDPATGNLIPDPQLRTYETKHGRFEGGQGMRTHNVIRMNQIMSDTRIPPEGFMPRAPDMAPSGRDYGSRAPYRHYDEHKYSIVLPDVARSSTGTLTIRAKYQVTDGEVVGYLVSEAGSSSRESRDLSRSWERFGRAAPRTMAEVKIRLTVDKALVAPDAGTRDADPAAVDPGADEGGDPPPMKTGCSCEDTREADRRLHPRAAVRLMLAASLAVVLLLRRRRSRL